MADPVDVLWRGARAGHVNPAEVDAGMTIREAERVQLAVLERWRESGEALAGWKVAATSGRGRNAFGPGIRPFGYLLRSRIIPSGERIPLGRITRPGLETELCFRLATRLAGPDVTPDRARGALESVSPAFEINEDRVEGPQDDLGIRVADNLKGWGVVVGDETRPIPDPFDWTAIVSTMSHDGRLLERVAAAGHIDDHFGSIAALANELATFGLALEPGDRVITGSFTRQEVSGPGRFDGTFKPFGDVSVTFT